MRFGRPSTNSMGESSKGREDAVDLGARNTEDMGHTMGLEGLHQKFRARHGGRERTLGIRCGQASRTAAVRVLGSAAVGLAG